MHFGGAHHHQLGRGFALLIGFQGFLSGLLDKQMHQLFGNFGVGFGFPVKVLDDFGGRLGASGFALNPETVAVLADMNLQALFQQSQVLVELAAKSRQAVGVGWFQMKLLRFVGQTVSLGVGYDQAAMMNAHRSAMKLAAPAFSLWKRQGSMSASLSASK